MTYMMLVCVCVRVYDWNLYNSAGLPRMSNIRRGCFFSFSNDRLIVSADTSIIVRRAQGSLRTIFYPNTYTHTHTPTEPPPHSKDDIFVPSHKLSLNSLNACYKYTRAALPRITTKPVQKPDGSNLQFIFEARCSSKCLLPCAAFIPPSVRPPVPSRRRLTTTQNPSFK